MRENMYRLDDLLHLASTDASELGPFLLIGDGRYEASSTFQYVTTTAPAFDDESPRPLSEAVFIGLRKRTPRFENVILVGRADSNDIRITHSSVSKLHARIDDVDADGFSVRDAGSRNGTFVDALEAKTPIRTSCGDVLRFGDRRFRVRRTGRVLAAIAKGPAKV